MGVRTPASFGFSLIETTLSLAVAGILATAGVSQMDFDDPDLTAAQHELRATLEQAQSLARARGTEVSVGIRTPAGPDLIPARVSRKIRWGKPAAIPLPPGMEDPVKADTTGEAHTRIVVTPHNTATASAWFVNDGKEALCMRLSGRGHLQMLRWKADRKRWVKV